MAPSMAAEPPPSAAARPAGEVQRRVGDVVVEVLGCLSNETVCTLQVDARTDMADIKAAVERRTGTARAAQRFCHKGRQLSNHEEVGGLLEEASVIQLRLVLVDPEWVEVCNAMEFGSMRLDEAREEHRADLDVVLAAVRFAGVNLEHASEELRGKRSVVLTAVRQNGLALKFASEEMRSDLEVVLAAVRANGLALEFAAPSLQEQREVVLAAVRKNGFALSFAPEVLRNDRDVALEAVNRDGRALAYTSTELKHDREVVVAACADNNECQIDVPEELMKDPEVIKALMTGIRIGGDMGGVIAWGVEMRNSYVKSMEMMVEGPDWSSDTEGDE